MEYRRIVGVLILHYPQLRGRVFCHGMMTVQVIRREVCDDRDPRARFEPLQLKTAHLQHHPIISGHGCGLVEQWTADVPANVGGNACHLGHLAKERGGRRLAVAAGDTHDWSRTDFEEEIRQRRYSYAARMSIENNGRFFGDRGVQVDSVIRRQIGMIVACNQGGAN
jgi:hypothetical protein